jgi:transposase
MDREGVRIVGFDAAEEKHDAVLLSRDGQEEFHLSCRNRVSSIEEAFGELMMRLAPGERLLVVLESPRSHGRLIYEMALRLGCGIWQVSTVAVNHYREVEGQPRKDDPWDAYLAARMVFLGAKRVYEVAERGPEERALSRLCRARSKQKDRRVKELQQLRSMLLELAPEVLHKQWGGPKYDSQAMLKILKRWPAFGGLERAQRKTIERVFRGCRYGKRSEGMVDCLRHVAGEVIVPDHERSVMALEMTLILRQIDLCEESIKSLENEIKELTYQHPVCIKLIEMPGIGFLTAAVLVGELLPVARNTSEAQSATYSGITPLCRKTGKSTKRSRLTRGANKHVLNTMFLSSVRALKESALDRAYYDKKRNDYQGHPKPHTAATLALARQRHKVIHRLMTTDARYDKERLIASHLERQKVQTCA